MIFDWKLMLASEYSGC